MKKETKAYVKNVIKSEFFFVDLINVILGIAIVALTFLSLLYNGQMIWFSFVFLLGMVLMALNCYKGIRQKTIFSVPFGILAAVMAAAAAFTFYML